jgi:hypothetical protein
MAVGDTHTVQALNAAGKPVTGLVWTSSDATIVSLSTDSPPVLTALAIGHATISAGGASADVTVSPTLALGTILGSNPGNGSGVNKIVPAVPSSSGVADVFAFQNDGTVEAITSDGITAWTAAANSDSVPNFQGGLIVRHYDPNTNSYSIQKLDGATGLPYPPYSLGPDHELLVHPDGTVFAVDGNEVVAVDPITGTSKFTIPVPGNYPASGIDFVQPIIAGDGYAYVPFVYRSSDCINVSLDMLRISTTGAYDRIPVITRPTHSCEWEGIVANVITNADSGVLLSWKSTDYQQSSTVAVDTYGMAIAAGTTVNLVNAPQLPGQNGPVIPVLQAGDGSYIGTVESDTGGIVAFDRTGAVRWTLPGYWQPEIATADGGVIASELDENNNPIATVTFDQNGNATGQMNPLTPSWTGNWYRDGDVEQVALAPALFAFTYAAAQGGNPSNSGAHVTPQYSPQQGLYDLARANPTSSTQCNALLAQFAAMGNVPEPTLIAQLQSAANRARNFVYDGPSSPTALTAAKFPGLASPGITTVGQWFAAHNVTGNYAEGLSQFNGDAIWVRFDEWLSWLFRTLSPHFLTSKGKLNSYAMGTLMHEILHKQSVGGGFTHQQMNTAIQAVFGSLPITDENPDSVGIGNACFGNVN